MNVETISPDLDGSGLRIGIVQSRVNTMVTDGLRDVCATELVRLGVNADDILMLTVPGALEIPLVLQKLAETGGFDALIALGAVIRGETYHFELVSNEVASGISAVALSCGIPVINAVLTTNTDEQAEARISEKGSDAARGAIEMANLCSDLDALNEAAEDDDD